MQIKSFNVKQLKSLIYYECLLQFRQPYQWLTPLWFFLLVLIIIPLATTVNHQLLIDLGPGIIWVAILLAVTLSIPRLFLQDYQDGSLEQCLISAEPFAMIIAAKILSQWLMLVVPLILILPIAGLLYAMQLTMVIILILTVVLGTPSLILLGAIIAAITMGLRHANLLLALLLIPLYIPPIILATTTIQAAALGISYLAPLLLLSALFIALIIIAPGLTAMMIRINFQYDGG